MPPQPSRDSADSISADSISAGFSAEGLRHAVRHASRLTALAQVASHVVSLIVLATLFRLVDPRDFGLLAMVAPVLLLFRIFTMFGLNVATVQQADLSAARVTSLFWWHLIFAVAATVAALLAAPGVAWFYGEPALVGLTAALSATSLAAAVGLQHVALLERNLRLGRAAAARLGGQIAGGLAGVVVAWQAGGVWALVAQQYVELLTLAAVAWRLEPWRPLGPRGGAPVRDLLRFGGYFTLSNLVFYLWGNLDKILVGVLLGPRALGLYSQAFNLMMKPVLVLTTPLSSVMLPALSRSAHDPANYRQILLAFQRLLAVASFPAAVGLLIVAPEAMLVLGGSKWTEAGGILSALAATILAQGFINMAGSIFVSAGQWRPMLWGAVAMVVVLAQGLAAGLYLGRLYDEPTLGVAWGFSLTTCLVLFLPYMAYCLRTVGVPLSDWLRQLARPAAAAACMGVIVWCLKLALARQPDLPAIVVLSVEIAAGVAVYGALAWREVRWCLAQLTRLR